MNLDDYKSRVIQNYETNEKAMVLIFSQWCINHGLDPKELYKKAYEHQGIPRILEEAILQTVPKDEATDISHDTVLNALQMFGNDDLAQIVQREIMSLEKK